MTTRPPSFEFTLPGLFLKSLNSREHYMVKAKRVAREVEVARKACALAILAPMTWPILVSIVRVRPKGKKRLDRWENLPGSCKGVIDGLCAALRIDDDDDRFEVKFAQAVGDDWGVRIRIESLGDEAIVPRVEPVKRRRVSKKMPPHLRTLVEAELAKKSKRKKAA